MEVIVAETQNGVRFRIPAAVIAVILSIVAGAAINDYIAKSNALKDVIDNEHRDAAAIKDIADTNRALLREMKAVRIGLAKSGVMIQVDP